MSQSQDPEDLLNKQLSELAKFIVENFMEVEKGIEWTNQKVKDFQAQVETKKKLSSEGAVSLFRMFNKGGSLDDVISKISKSSIEEIAKGRGFGDEELDAIMEVFFDAYDKGDLQTAKQVISLVVKLYPYNVEGYLIMADMIWNIEGITEATNYYKFIIEHLKNPKIFLEAAKYFIMDGDIKLAKETLYEAARMCGGEDHFKSLRNEIDTLHEEILSNT